MIRSRCLLLACHTMLYGPLAVRGLAAEDCAANLSASRPPEFTLREFFDTVSNISATFSPDDRTMYYASNESGVFNIWKVAVEGGTPEQVTRSEESIMTVTHAPNSDELIYAADRGGDENYHLFRMPSAGGPAVDLTPGDGVRAEFAMWSHDGNAFYYSCNRRDPRVLDVYAYDMKSGQSRMVFENPGRDTLAAVSRDGRFLALTRFYNVTNTDMLLYDVEKKELKPLSEHEGEIIYASVGFSPDDKELYYLTDRDSDFTYLMKLDLTTNKAERVLSSDWDVVFAGFSHNGRYLITATNEDGRTRIKMVDRESGKPVKLPDLPDGEISSISITRSEKLMSYSFQGDARPADLHVMNLSDGRSRQMTKSLKDNIQQDYLVDSCLLRYPARDQLQIPAYLYVPKGRAGEKLPAIIWVHGGPMGQSTKGFSALRQFFVNHGYVVLMPNVRGSTGYGKKYHMMDDKDWGGAPLQDVIAGKRYLETLPYVDAGKIVILGGSYGGYMVLSALTREPDAFAAGVDICGPSNLFTLMASIPPYWEPFKVYFEREVGHVERDKEFLTERSPLFSADRIRAPLFVIQGANDPRVKQAESDQIVEAIRQKNGVVEYLTFPDEGHGLRKKENNIAAYSAVMEILDRHVRGAKPSAAN